MLTPPPVRGIPDCRAASSAKAAAHDAIEVSGAALAQASCARRDVQRIKFGQWLIGTLVTLVGILLTWITTSQPDRNAEAARSVASATADSMIRQHVHDTEGVTDDAVERGSDRALAKFLERQNPAPIAKIPDIVTSRTDTDSPLTN
jgi:hypothetical protein